jgi:zinc/manganese transport system substrate-binding protein
MSSMTERLETATPVPARALAALAVTVTLALPMVTPASNAAAADEGIGTVAVTTEVLGSVVDQLVGDAGEVVVIMPGGANPHSYEPSARDAERILDADVVVSNGLDLEEGLLDLLASVEGEGGTWFQAADHVALRDLEGASDEEADHADEEADHADEEADHADHGHVGADPHFWTDPLLMRDVVLALGPVLAGAGLEVDGNVDVLVDGLEVLDAEVTEILTMVPEDDRKLVTGHRSLGYFADRYGFEQIGTVIPSLSTSGEPTARDLARLIEDIRANGVTAVFTEVGTPVSVAQAVADDSGAELVELSTSQLPAGGTYQDLIRELATTIAGALGG